MRRVSTNMKVDHRFFEEHGYVVVKGMIDQEEVALLLEDYNKMVTGQIPMKGFDGLNAKVDDQNKKVVQIANPSQQYEKWKQYSYLKKALDIAKELAGEDVEYKYDQIIYKPAYNPVETVWHQDAAYWNNNEKRAVTCWLALTPAFLENGGMRFIPGSHREDILEHTSLGSSKGINEALGITNMNESQAISHVLLPGDASFHHHKTIHGTNANNTQMPRCALITHFESKH
jgi:phytanoyl-CoA hydroxylase